MTVYTVITSDYDNPHLIKYKEKGVRYVCITDDAGIAPNGWEIMQIERLNPPKNLSGVKLQRWAKVIGGMKLFKNDAIYIDGSHEIIGSMSEMFGYCGKNMALKKHPARECYIAEAEACKRLNKANADNIDRQVNANILSGVPGNYGMFETGVLIRRYNPNVMQFNEKWWSEIERYTHRDQLSITKALFITGIGFDVFTQQAFKRYLKVHNHK